MQKPENYDDTKPRTIGTEYPPSQPYVMRIVDAREETSKNGRQQLVFDLDIAEGQYKEFYANLSSGKQANKYLRFYQGTGGDSVAYFKGSIEVIEKCNTGFTFNFNEKSLIGKLVGANMRDEEYEDKDGTLRAFGKVAFFVDAQKVRDGKIAKLDPKKLATKSQSNNRNQSANYDDKDLPF